MTTTKVYRAPVDTWVSESEPGQTRVFSHILRVNGDSGGGKRKRAFIFFPITFDPRFSVVSATLYLHSEGGISGSPTLTVDRITSSWKAQKTTWNNQPTISTTHEATTSGSGVGDGDPVTFDVTNILNDVASGQPWYGLRLVVTGTTNWDFSSSESTKPGKKLRLEVTYGLTPDPPTDLRPCGGQAIGVSQPVLAWSSEVNQASFQVQVSSDPVAFVAHIVYDSGVVNDDRQSLQLAGTGFSLPGGIIMRYWRVRVKNSIGLWSDYSDIVAVYYDPYGTLNIYSPSNGGFVEETTPRIDWTFSGQTQKSFRLALYDLSTAKDTLGWGDDWGTIWGGPPYTEIWNSGWQMSSDTFITIPPHHIKVLSAGFYAVRVWVHDTKDRTSSPGSPEYVTDYSVFYFSESTVPSPVSALVLTNPEGWYIQLNWTDGVEPDYYGFKVDGKYVLDRETPSKYHLSGTSYMKKFYNVQPLDNSVYEVVRITKDLGVYKHSRAAVNPTVTYRFIPKGVWIIDEDTDKAVNVGVGGDDVTMDLRIGEGDTVYYPLGRRDPVRVVDAVRGYEGTITGKIRGKANKEQFEFFKAQLPTKMFRLIGGDLSIRVHLGEVALSPTNNPLRGANPDASDKLWDVSLEVFQAEDWTFQARY